jgi:cyclophilin family peptidyl-prolyl cis-trans isomerase/protein-disulfide isomerase
MIPDWENPLFSIYGAILSMNMKRVLTIVYLAALLLSACGQAVPGTPLQSSKQTLNPTPASGIAQITPTHAPGCTVKTARPQANPTVQSLLPAVTKEDWVRGSSDAFETIIEYCDFQGAGCAQIAPVLTQLQTKYPKDVRIVYRHFPLSNDDKAALATQAAEAAGLQGKFWEMHDLLFAQNKDWVGLSVDQFQDWLVKRAGELGLDVEKFKTDLNSAALVAFAKDAFERNAAIGMPGVPFLVVNGLPYNAPVDFGNLDTMTALMLLEKRQFSDCPPVTIDPKKQYLAILHTEKGDITLELFADKAPLAVNSFIFLARNHWYDGVTFHRVIPGFVAQAGDPTGTGIGGPGYAFDNEISPDLKFDGPGVLGMANAGPGSNGSQFFITYSAVPRLNGGYTIFGKLVAGMDVLQKLTPRDPSTSMDLPPGDKVLSVEIVEK